MNSRRISSYLNGTSSFLLLSMLILLAVLPACTKKKEEDSAQKRANMPVPVKLAEAIQQPMPEQITTIGTIEPLQTVQIKPQVSAQVMEVRFKEGDAVESGQILFILDKRPFEVALDQARANLSKAEALAVQAKALLARDQALVDRSDAFFTRDQGLFEKGMISKEEYDTSRANARTNRAAVDADQASLNAAVESVAAAKNAIDQATLQLDYCTITAPIAGQTGEVTAKVGNLVRTGDAAPMVTINEIAPIRADFSLPERHLSTVRKYLAQGPLTVEARIKGEEAAPCTGALSFIDNAVDTATGTIRLKAQFDNTDHRLWPGQFVQIILQISVTSDAIVVPSRAIQMGQKGAYLYVATSDMTVEMRPIKAGGALGEVTAVLPGDTPETSIKVGEKVVIDGQSLLKPGAAIKLAEEKPADTKKTADTGSKP